MKNIILFVSLFFLFIFWCSENTDSEQQKIDFGPYSINISKEFKPTVASSFENKRTKDKIAKVYVLPTNIWLDSFQKNMIIWVLPNSRKVDSKSFTDISSTNISKVFDNYNKTRLTKHSINCSEQKIEIYKHSFEFTEKWTTKKYFISQWYWSDDDRMYVVSIWTDNESDTDIFDDYVDTISCK